MNLKLGPWLVCCPLGKKVQRTEAIAAVQSDVGLTSHSDDGCSWHRAYCSDRLRTEIFRKPVPSLWETLQRFFLSRNQPGSVRSGRLRRPLGTASDTTKNESRAGADGRIQKCTASTQTPVEHQTSWLAGRSQSVASHRTLVTIGSIHLAKQYRAIHGREKGGEFSRTMSEPRSRSSRCRRL